MLNIGDGQGGLTGEHLTTQDKLHLRIIATLAVVMSVLGYTLHNTYGIDEPAWPWVLATFALATLLFVTPARWYDMPIPRPLRSTLNTPWFWLLLATALNFTVLLFGFEYQGARYTFGNEAVSIRSSLLSTMAVIVFFALWQARYTTNTTSKIWQEGSLIVLLWCNLLLLLIQPDLFIIPFWLLLFVLVGQKLKGLLGRSMQLTSLAFVVGGAWLLLNSPYRLERLIGGWINYADNPYGSGYQLNQSLEALRLGGWFGNEVAGYNEQVLLPVDTTAFAVPMLAYWLGMVSIILMVGLIAGFAWSLWKLRSNRLGVVRYVLGGLLGLYLYNHIIVLGVPMGALPLFGQPLGLAFIGAGAVHGVLILAIIFLSFRYGSKNV